MSSKLEREIEYLSKSLKETVITPSRYSEAYLMGRDLTNMNYHIPPRSQASRDIHNDGGECSSAATNFKPKRVHKKKEAVKEEVKSVQKPTMADWSDYISKDVQSMKNGIHYNSLSDAYIYNMPPEIISLFMSVKFRNPPKHIKECISRSGADKHNALLQDALNNDDLKLAVRTSVGKMIKKKIIRMEYVSDELKNDVVQVFE